jgi:hypothetical protein
MVRMLCAVPANNLNLTIVTAQRELHPEHAVAL